MSNPILIKNIINKIQSTLRKGKGKKRKKENNITTHQLKILFNIEAKEYYACLNKIFLVNNENRNFLNLICKYFAQDNTFETIHKGDLNKGLFIAGSNGAGKSSSFLIIQQISKKYNLREL